MSGLTPPLRRLFFAGQRWEHICFTAFGASDGAFAAGAVRREHILEKADLEAFAAGGAMEVAAGRAGGHSDGLQDDDDGQDDEDDNKFRHGSLLEKFGTGIFSY